MKNILIGLVIGVLITLYINRDKELQINNYGPSYISGVWHFDGDYREFKKFENGEFVEIFTLRDYALEISKSEKMVRVEITNNDDKGRPYKGLCSQASERLAHVSLMKKLDFDSASYIKYNDVEHLKIFSPKTKKDLESYFIYKSLLEFGHRYDTLYHYKSGPEGGCWVYLRKENVNTNENESNE